MKKVVKIVEKTISCCQECPHFSTEGMERIAVCNHPSRDYKNYDGYGLDWSVVRKGYPKDCPL